jgi:hypothetical protein
MATQTLSLGLRSRSYRACKQIMYIAAARISFYILTNTLRRLFLQAQQYVTLSLLIQINSLENINCNMLMHVLVFCACCKVDTVCHMMYDL